MMYLWPGCESMIGYHPGFGVICSPGKWVIARGIREGRKWAGDNEAFTRDFEPTRFFGFYEKLKPWRETCLFIACPDSVGDALATLDLYRQWATQIKQLGFPVAFVAQDGQESLDFPAAFDVLFIGGTTEWKMSPAADNCIRRAKAIGKPVHVGRVNSIKRFRHFQLMEVDTCDGTEPAYHPDRARKLLAKAVGQRALLSLLH